MSTTEGLEKEMALPSSGNDFRQLIGGAGIVPSADVALEAAQKELDDERDGRKGERFYWICLVTVLVDLFMFKDMGTWSGPIVIGVLEFIVLISLGRQLGNDQIWTLTELIIRKWNGKIPDAG